METGSWIVSYNSLAKFKKIVIIYLYESWVLFLISLDMESSLNTANISSESKNKKDFWLKIKALLTVLALSVWWPTVIAQNKDQTQNIETPISLGDPKVKIQVDDLLHKYGAKSTDDIMRLSWQELVDFRTSFVVFLNKQETSILYQDQYVQQVLKEIKEAFKVFWWQKDIYNRFQNDYNTLVTTRNNITQNEKDIAKSKNNITQNEKDIAKNKEDIAKNKEDIANINDIIKIAKWE